ncbi:MAG: shikimate kinase [Chitinophagales bacterium]
MHNPLFLIGFMASGKTSIGRKLAKAWQMNFIDLDKAIEESEQMTINQIFETKGEEYFRQLETESLQKLDVENTIVATGGGTACFHDNIAIMQTKGKVIYIDVPTKILIGRLKQQKDSRPLVKDLDEKQLIDFVNQTMEKRLPFYGQADVCIDGTLGMGRIKEFLS